MDGCAGEAGGAGGPGGGGRCRRGAGGAPVPPGAGGVCGGGSCACAAPAPLFTSAARGAQWRARSQSDGRLDVNSEAAVGRRLQPVYLHNSNSQPGGRRRPGRSSKGRARQPAFLPRRAAPPRKGAAPHPPPRDHRACLSIGSIHPSIAGVTGAGAEECRRERGRRPAPVPAPLR